MSTGVSTTSVLASGSWDGTMKLWNVYENKNIETMEHGCDVLALAFRPGKLIRLKYLKRQL